MYNLLVEGIRDLGRYTSLLQQRKVSHDPLSGIVDGANLTFHTQFAPLLTSGSIVTYASGSIFSYSDVDYETGRVTFTNAPVKQPDASYTFTPFTASQQASMLMAGFDEMQSRWVRSDFRLSSGSTMYVPATEYDSAIYLCQLDPSTSGSVIDPPSSGSIPFSLCRTQIRFYMACCSYSYQARQLMETSMTGVSFRERSGAQLDRTRIPQNVKLALDETEKSLIRALKAAWDEFYQDGEQYGEAILPQHSTGYETMFDWHDNQYPSTAEESQWL